jgi:hypothetical protein
MWISTGRRELNRGAAHSVSTRQRANGEDLVCAELFNVRFRNGYDGDRLSHRIEDLQNATLLASLRMPDVIDQDRHVALSELMLG